MRSSWRYRPALVALAIFLTVPAVATAAPGDLDPAFSTDGKATVKFKGKMLAKRAYGLLASPGPKPTIVTTVVKAKRKGADRIGNPPSDVAVARLTKKGKLDRKFSRDGRNVLVIPGSETAYAATTQPGGKTLIAGAAQNDMVVIRLDRKGNLDKSFSADGRTAIDFGLEDGAEAIAVQPDGSIVVAGFAVTPATSDQDFSDRDLAVARLTPTGALDPSFGGDGKVTLDLRKADAKNASSETARSVIVAPSGVITAAGYGSTDFEYAGSQHPVAAQLTPTGELTGFGQVSVDDVTISEEVAAATQANGQLVFGATIGEDFGALRLDGVGQLDPSYATGGVARVDLGGREDRTDAIAIQPDNFALLGGGAPGVREGGDFALLRLTATGQPDPNLSENGKLTVDFGRKSFDDADGVGLDGASKIVLGGTVGDTKVGLTRHLNVAGPADFDADGVEDADDSCPDQFGTRANGCPKRKR